MAWLPMGIAAAPVVAQVDNGSVRVRAVRSRGEIVEELAAREPGGSYRTILVSPTHPLLGTKPKAPRANLLRGAESGLFDAAPTFRFSTATVDGRTLTLSSVVGSWKVTKALELPVTGNTLTVTLTATTASPYPQIRYLLNTYAFAPGIPDETWAPALRGGAENVVGDHFFRSPAVIARKGALAATIMPDLDVLAENRPIPTILDLDVANGVVDAALLSYGFCDHRVSGHVRFSHDASMIRASPPSLICRSEIRLDADASPGSPLHEAATYLWDRYGRRYFDRILPQTMPFAQYAELCYPAAFAEKMTGGWFERTIYGHVCGGLPSGWGLDQGWVSWQCWFNQLRSAWGLRWWGKRLNHPDWVERSEKMLNLALAAPTNQGACPSTYLSRTNEWRGSLITPTAECYYDLPSIAWKGIWYLRWLALPDCPRRDDVRRAVDGIVALMTSVRRADGSFPSWLDKNLKPIAVLDRSAQSALPAWFLSECEKRALATTADFLTKSVVPNSLYYDFETFFSCSAKACLQVGGVLDNPQMWDPHTRQAPQNTLSMQWTAEAIALAAGYDNPGANKALDTMSMYQNVWPISYRPVAYTFGGFGVQNSDGEYNDARQAQFGATLCEFGAKLGRRDLFERGVAAVRASLALVNVPNDPFHVYPNPNYPPGLEPENCGHGGTNEQDGRTGFDWGEGSGLAAAAELIDKYGSTYEGPGWKVVIDGTPTALAAPSVLENPRFEFDDWRLPGWTVDGNFLRWPARSDRADFGIGSHPFIGTCEDGHGGYDDAYTGTLTSPVFTVFTPTIHLLVGGGALDGVGVELIDESGKRLMVARGENRERMGEVTWDIPPTLHGQKLRIRIFDHETGGWGHVNVGWIRCE